MEPRDPSRINSSEPPGMLGGSNSFGPGSIVLPASTIGMMSGMRLSFNPMPPAPAPAPVSKPTDSSGSLFHGDDMQVMRPSGMLSVSAEPMKKKRGRPRKYGSDSSMALALTSPTSTHSNTGTSESSVKRRGRPPGSGKKQQRDALGSPGIAFTPHIITVQAGEDVASKIMAFSQQGLRTICVLSANGTICNVTLRQPATSGGTVTYEGRFEILALSGSFLLTEEDGTRSRTGGLSVTLAGSDSRVIGGGVAGMLTAAGPVQVVVGSFIAERKKAKPNPKPKPKPVKRSPSSVAAQCGASGAQSMTSPTSEGSESAGESSPDDDDGSDSPVNDGGGNLSQRVHSIPSYTPVVWPHPANQQG